MFSHPHVSEMRFNPITRDWVIIAPGRSRKPNDFRAASKSRAARPVHRADCPFCVGNEESEEILRASAPDGSWLARVIPNKFPALSGTLDPQRERRGSFRSMSASGAHEVLVEHPRHDFAIPDMTPAHLATVLGLYRERYAALREQPGIESIIIFKNHGERAGTSLEHPHSQIVAAPVVSSTVRLRLEEATRAHDEDGECIYCTVLRDELAGGDRMIEANDAFVAFVPFAALSPYHIWIFPRRHASSYDAITPAEIAELAPLLHRVLCRLHVALEDPDFNFGIRSAPISEANSHYFHWYLAIVPRVSHVAGFELGSGIFINSMLPEDAAARLRGAAL
jgi:UDPglucose--hexose-1-phosphate uridylyltransferase